MRILASVLFSALLLMSWGCATVSPAGSSVSALNFYTFDDSQSVGLIRAFQDENTTVLQFANLEGETFVIFDGEGRQLNYERVGEHYVILPGTYGSLTVKMVMRNASVNITGVSDKMVKNREMARSKVLTKPLEPKTPIPAIDQKQAVEPEQRKAADPNTLPKLESKVLPVSNDIETPSKNQCTASGLPGYVVQIGSCKDRQSAEKLKERLVARGYDAEIKVRSAPKRGAVYGVRLHPMGLIAAYDAIARLRHDLGVHSKLMEIPAEELAAYEEGK